MHATEIVKGKMQVDSSPKILQFPRKRVRQSRETAKLHSYRQVLALDKTSRNVIGIRISAANFGYNLRDLSWGVAFIPLLAIISVELRKLREIGIAAERCLDSLAVKDVGIGGQLDTMIGDSTPQFAHKELGVLAGAFADHERRNEFCVRVERNDKPTDRRSLPDRPYGRAALFSSGTSRFHHTEGVGRTLRAFLFPSVSRNVRQRQRAGA